jgi:hypothetical protein
MRTFSAWPRPFSPNFSSHTFSISVVLKSMAAPRKSSSQKPSVKATTVKEPALAPKLSKVTKQKTKASPKQKHFAPDTKDDQAANRPGRWDDWVPQERLRKLTEDNLQLAKQLKKEVEQLQKQPRPDTKKSGGQKRKGGESVRATSSPMPQIVNKKRGRDLETEKVFDPYHCRS